MTDQVYFYDLIQLGYGYVFTYYERLTIFRRLKNLMYIEDPDIFRPSNPGDEEGGGGGRR